MSSPRRILALHHVTEMAGAERGLVHVARALRDGGHVVEVALPGDGPLTQALRDDQFIVHNIPTGRVYRTRNLFDLLNIAWRISRVTVGLCRIIRQSGIDVLHCNSDTAMLFGGLAARLTGKPCIWHRRDLVNLGWSGRLLARGATRILAISDAVTDASRQYVQPAGRLTTIYNGIDMAELQVSRPAAAVREELGIPAGATVIANIGQLIPWKKQDVFLDVAERVASQLPAAWFLLIGADLYGDHAAYVAKLRAAAMSGTTKGRVIFTGHRPDIADLIAATDVVVHTAEREPFGRAVAEAMAMGLPVVAIDACGPSELIVHPDSGYLVPPGDPHALAQAVVNLVANPTEAGRMGEAGSRRVLTCFSIAGFRARLCDLYAGLYSDGDAT